MSKFRDINHLGNYTSQCSKLYDLAFEYAVVSGEALVDVRPDLYYAIDELIERPEMENERDVLILVMQYNLKDLIQEKKSLA